jgi:cytochrome bd-type quinol oxidase subunit 2
MNFLDIPFSQAWAYAFTLTGYIVPLIIVTIFSALAGLYIKKDVKQYGFQMKHTIIMFIMLIAIMGALLGLPASVAANSTPGHIIR